VGTGISGANQYQKDFYEFDSSANKWTRKADFSGSARENAVGFSVNGKGYIGIGYESGYLKDFFEYFP